MVLGAESRRLLVSVILGGLLSCSDSDDRCDEGGEFANDGCARIGGVIRSPDGTPLSGVLVTVRARIDDSAVYTGPSATTGPTGRFVLELFRLASEVPPQAQASLYLQMILVRETSVVDSVLTEVEFAPVGELIPATEVEAVFDTLAAASVRVGA